MGDWTGTAKQVEWAQEIRSNILACMTDARDILAAAVPSSVDLIDGIIRETSEITDAAWWIDNGRFTALSARFLLHGERIPCAAFPLHLVDAWMDRLDDGDVSRLMDWQRYEGKPSYPLRLADFRDRERRDEMRDILLDKVCRLYLRQA